MKSLHPTVIAEAIKHGSRMSCLMMKPALRLKLTEYTLGEFTFGGTDCLRMLPSCSSMVRQSLGIRGFEDVSTPTLCDGIIASRTV